MTYGMYSSLGHCGPAIALTGIWNNVVKLGLPVLAFVILAVMGGATAAEMTAALIGVGALSVAVVAFALMLRSDAPIGAACYAWWRVTEGRRTGALQLSSTPAGVS